MKDKEELQECEKCGGPFFSGGRFHESEYCPVCRIMKEKRYRGPAPAGKKK